MRKRILQAAAPLAALAIAFALAACGDDVPPNAVAKVGDSAITKTEFAHWLGAAARSQQQGLGGGAAVVPDPPNFTSCAAAKAKQPVPKGAPRPTPKKLHDQCKQEYDALKEQVMQFLVSAEWIQAEAKAQGVKATPAEIQRSFEQQKKQSFPSEKQYQQFLKSSGQTEQDLMFRVKLDVLTNEIRQKAVEGKGKVSGGDVSAYYNKNKSRFGQPERRDLLVVLTQNAAQAQKAKQALDSGQPWAAVAKKYSIDDASKAQGGKLPNVAKGQQERALDTAVFKAKKSVVVGPVKTQFGYYVFKVTKVTPGTQQSLAQANSTIRNLLRSQKEQQALDDFVKGFRKKYKAETHCAKGYVIPDCENAPKQKTQTGAASGGAPQGAPQGQQVPQQGQQVPQG